jgi:hypothetical protein
MQPNQLRTREDGRTVPVMLDAIRDVEGHPLARCVYLVISAEEPAAGWELALADSRMPIALVGLTAIVLQPDAATDRFLDVATIDRLYGEIESIPGLMIDIDDVWLPAGPFEGGEPGAIFRVAFELFSRGYALRENRLSAEDLAEAGRRLPDAVIPSPEETRVFREWNRRVIADARQLYHRNQARALAWRE